MKVAEYAKAITSALVSGYSVFEVASSLASPGGETVTGNEWVRVGVFTLLAGLAVWLIPNEKKSEPLK